MSEKPKTPKKPGKTGFQVFVSDLAVQRFRAACALVGIGQTETTEKLMNDFADAVGIPTHVPVPPKRKSPQRH